ncbi:MAG: hypothetical protein WCG99_01395 [Candidatus Berkelbacteria bacterium]
MAKEKGAAECCSDDDYKKYMFKRHHKGGGAMGGGVYGLAFIGAVIYLVQHSTTFWMGVLGVLKALVWPALIMYKVLGILHF